MTAQAHDLAIRRIMQAAQQLDKLAEAFRLVGNEHIAGTLDHLATDLIESAQAINENYPIV